MCRRAFSVAGPVAWNSLPDFIRDPTSSTDCFRRLLKTYFFSRVTNASSALRVLNDYALYKSTHSLTHSLFTCSEHYQIRVYTKTHFSQYYANCNSLMGGLVAEWLTCWTQEQPRRCRVTLLGKLFTPIVPLFTKQQHW